MKHTLLDKMLDEKIVYGGLVVTRRKALAHIQAGNYVNEGHDRKREVIDWFVFKPDALPSDTPEWTGGIPD